MKNYNRQSFRNLLAILLVFMICPMFGADDEDNDALSSQEGIVDSLIGPGSFARGYCEYFITNNDPQWSKKECIRCASLGTLTLFSTALALFMPFREDEPNFARYISITTYGISTLVSILGIYKNLPPLNDLALDDLRLIRDIQKSKANKIVEDENIKKYISELLTWHDRMQRPPVEDNPRIQFFNQYRKKNRDQLQHCTEQVLIKRALCRKVDDHFEVECIGDQETVFGPRILNPVRYLRFDILRKILDKDHAIVEANNYENMPEFLNELLGYAGQTIKPAIKSTTAHSALFAMH